ncbi:hypothetical protein DNHGIG_25920 [Collibacillus ludicampi]|uniref:Phage protein D n=1 Tax=Collibacillus ludicampi TaxID=2771369 RepID=A0AAV4LH52_9BACL|nr:hypothetical protein [Collibacillus ludicampi]GIM47043.1 hypothetical protein DNHGIG_25920 [Collibacillus ludicampi]
MIEVPFHGNLRGVSKPRSIVRIDGYRTWFNSWEVNLNSTHEADDFTLELPFRITRNQQQGYLVNTPEYTTYLFTKSDVLVEIFVGYPQNPQQFQESDLTRIMYGYMDTAEIRADASGEIVTLTGRNMIAPFLDNKTTEKYQNMTSSAIAQMLAARRGLQASVTPTYTLTGKYYNGDHVEMNKDVSEWDLLTFLAEQEGYALRVKDNTLFFGPFDQVIGNITNAPPLNYTWGQNIESFTLSRSPHAAKNIEVEVHSYDQKTGKHILAKTARNYAMAQNTYHERYFYPGLTQDQAQKKAQSILDQLSKLEVTGTMNVAGNEQLTVDRRIALYGVGLGLSETYFVRKASHKFDYKNGYRCEITFSNLLLPDEQTGGM